MKKIFLILSLIFFSSCHKGPEDYPVDFLYVVDLSNSVCAKYQIVNKREIKVELKEELALIQGGPCDRLVGHEFHDFKKVQNFLRDLLKGE